MCCNRSLQNDYLRVKQNQAKLKRGIKKNEIVMRNRLWKLKTDEDLRKEADTRPSDAADLRAYMGNLRIMGKKRAPSGARQFWPDENEEEDQQEDEEKKKGTLVV